MEGSYSDSVLSCTSDNNVSTTSLQGLLQAQARRNPEAVAFITADGRQCTFGAWDKLSSSFALKLRATGVQPRDLVTIFTEQTPEYYIGVFAILKLGAAFVPLDTRSPVERSVAIIRDHGIRVLVATKNHNDILQSMDLEGIQTEIVPRYDSNETLPDVNFSIFESLPNDPCYNICTSGSTGKPKGVLVAHRGMINIIKWLDEKTPMKTGDVGFTAFALHFDGFLLVFHHLAFGATIFMLDSSLFLDMKTVSRELIKHRVNYITGVPTWTNLLFSYTEAEGVTMPDMKYVLCGGEVASFAMVKRIAVSAPNSLFINIYGPTETTVFCIAHVCDPKTETAPPPIGKLLSGNYMYIMDESMKEVAQGEQGEIYIGGAGVALRYSNNPQLTQQLFIPDPFDSSKIIYKTGDFARIRPDGNVEYIARRTDQVKIAGFRVEIGEIQHAINAYAYTQDSFVFPVNTTPNDEKPVYKLQAFVVPNANAPTGDFVSGIMAYLQPKLPHYMLPSIEAVPELVFNANGKVDFRKMLANLEAKNKFVPVNKEEVLLQIAQQVLHCSVRPTDNLVELGMNSILATQFIWQASQSGVPVTIEAIFSSPTVRSLVDQQTQGGDSVQEIHLEFNIRDSVPLTYGERSLYSLQALNMNSVAYNEPFTLLLPGKVDLANLKVALSMVADRHPNLRAQYSMDANGAPCKKFAPKSNIEIVSHGSYATDASELQAHADSLLATLNSTPFDMERGPLVRVFLVQDEEVSTSIMGVSMHHIICDGWSVALFSYELATIYNLLSASQHVPSLDEVVRQAGLSAVDFVVPAPSEAALKKNTSFWANELEGNEQFIELPMDFARPKTRTEKGSTYSFFLSQQICDSLKVYCQQNNVTMFVALLSAYTAFLYRYSGSQKQFSIGIPAATRTPSTKNLFGYFVNALTMNMKNHEVTYEELTKSVQSQVLRCMAHKDMPIQNLVEAVEATRVGNYHPFFQCMFIMNQPVNDYLQTAFGKQMPEGWAVRHPHIDVPAKFDVCLILQDEEDGMSAQFQYSSELFKPATIGRMAEGFVTMLQGIISAPSVQITHVPCLTEADKRLIAKLNMTQSPAADVTSFTEMLTLQARKTPNNTAFVKPCGRKYTYREWDVCSSNFAMQLRAAGVKPGQIVSILTEYSFEYFVGVLAILKAGGVWLPIDPKAPVARTNVTLASNNIQFMVYNKHHSIVGIELTGANAFVAVPKHLKHAEVAAPEGFEMHVPSSEDTCYIICTSGSTGTPKAVMVPHLAIVNYTTWLTRIGPVSETDVGMFPMALHFDGSMSLFMVIAAGASLYLHDPDTQLNMDYISQEWCRHNINVAISLPTWTNLLYSNVNESQLSQVKFIGCGGDVIPQALPDRILSASPNAKFVNLYGPTECTVACMAYPYDKKKANGNALPIGKPISNNVVHLLDDNLQPVPIGVAGEICIGGTGVALGYYQAPELTQKAFVDTPLFPTKLYRTGDYARLRPDGEVEFMARRDGQVKIFGYRVETSEIYNVLCQSEYVQDAVVVPVKMPSNDPNGKASYELRGFVVLTEEHCDEPRTSVRKLITKFLQSMLPPYMIPKLNIMDQFPYAQSGKVDIKVLLNKKQDNDSDEDMDITPSTSASPIKDQVRAVFEEALGVGSIGEKSIFDLGGNSITAVAIVNKINAILGKQLPLISLFESGGTITGLTEKLSDAPVLSPREIFINKIVDLQNQYGHKIRRRLFEHMQNNYELFKHREDQTIDQQREMAWKRVLNLFQNKFLFYPTRETMPEYEAITEAITMFDFTIIMLWRNQFLAIVQCLQQTGSEAHYELMKQVAAGESTGAIALTELGHGSNTALIETVAVYDRASDCYVLNTPHDLAQKYWCGGAAKFALNLIVVAKLFIDNVDHGLHLFITPLRDLKGNITPGITVVDCGQKIGLNGVDNGRVWFHNLRLPRKGGMLDRFAQVNEKGEYVSIIPDTHVRNAAHLCEPLLVQGRLSISIASVAMCKTATTIAVRYASSRKQIGPKNLPIMDALAVQLRLFPHVARTWAMNSLTKFMVRCNVHPSTNPATGYTSDMIAQLSSAVKPYCTWMSLQVLRDCREVCGGQGFRSVNRIGTFIGDAEGLCTAEGAGDLLVPIFAKALHTEWVKFTSGVSDLTIRLKPLQRLYDENTRQQVHSQLKSTDARLALVSVEFQMNALLIREYELLNTVTTFYEENKHLDQFEADNMIFTELKELAFAHLERVALEQVIVVEPMVDAEILPLLELIRSTFVLDRLQNSPFSYHTLQFPKPLNSLIGTTIKQLCEVMKSHVVDMVDGFGVPDFLLGEAGNDWLSGNAEPKTVNVTEAQLQAII